MKTRELIAYSRRRIKGRRRAAFLICILPIGTELFFRTAEAALYSLMLYFGTLKPADLFTGAVAEQLVIAVMFRMLRGLITPALWCAAAVRLKELTDDKGKRTSFSDMLLNGRFIRRSIAAVFTGRIIGALALAPAVISGFYVYRLLSRGADERELLAASNAAALGVVSVILWLIVRITTAAVPFLLAEFPQKSAFGVVLTSFRFMRGRRNMPVFLGIAYLLPMLTVIAIPFLIPELAAAYTIGISIFLKEDEYVLREEVKSGRALFHRRFRNSRTASKVSSGEMGRFGRSAAKAEKP